MTTFLSLWMALGACKKAPEATLELGFQELEQGSSLAMVTDLEFLPAPSPDFLVTDFTGGFAWLRLEGDRAELVLEGQVPGVFVDGTGGLAGLAIDPGFTENRLFYLGFTDSPSTTTVRRYTLVDGDWDATTASAVDILTLGDPDAGPPHNMTSFGFDDDGLMWILAGDKSAPDAAQEPSELRGSLLQLDPSRDPGVGGFTVPDRFAPFAKGADPAVVAKGMRSPWKGLFHDGKVIYGEVGSKTIEEINIVKPGAKQNFGWPEVEGPCALEALGPAPNRCEDRFVDPWVYYAHGNSDPFVVDDIDANPATRRSIYAGWIHRPSDPDPYDGAWDDVLVFGDTFAGFVRAIRLGDDGDQSWHAGHVELPTAWGQGPDGHVYVMALDDWPPSKTPDPSPLYRALPR